MKGRNTKVFFLSTFGGIGKFVLTFVLLNALVRHFIMFSLYFYLLYLVVLRLIYKVIEID